jgi:hypothetical protein
VMGNVGGRFAVANAELSLRLRATCRRSASPRANKSLEPKVMACMRHLTVAASSCPRLSSALGGVGIILLQFALE